MQNNITELTQRLRRALDRNYNVIDMVAVFEVITVLERVSITKELLETTRLGKHINELRRNTTNESLAKRAKGLLKKWRSEVLAVPVQDTNGQLKVVGGGVVTAAVVTTTAPAVVVTVDHHHHHQQQQQLQQQQQQEKKRLTKEKLDTLNPAKRPRVNGTSEYDFSDNSNSSFKDVLMIPKNNVILINSDSNSSIPDVKNEPVLEEQQPKKRGRKKGSKNHKILLEEAESSFTNKMAVSRGNAKVKTTQELIAGLQSKINATTSPGKNLEDWNERAAKLTERVSLIDQKLYANANRVKKKKTENSKKSIIESGSVINTKIERIQSSSTPEIVSVDDDDDDVEEEDTSQTDPAPTVEPPTTDPTFVPSLSIEEALARLPPIDSWKSSQEEDDFTCTCVLNEDTFTENPDCPANFHLEHLYRLKETSFERIDDLHTKCVEGVNGNFGGNNNTTTTTTNNPDETEQDDIKIVPNFYGLSPKYVDRDSVCENYKKYSISERGTAAGGSEENEQSDVKFQEYHEVLDRPSYNGEVLRILPYVVID